MVVSSGLPRNKGILGESRSFILSQGKSGTKERSSKNSGKIKEALSCLYFGFRVATQSSDLLHTQSHIQLNVIVAKFYLQFCFMQLL